MRLHPWVLPAAAAVTLLAAHAVLAADGASAPTEGALPPAFAAATRDPALRSLWDEGLALERAERLAESSQRYEALARSLPDSTFIRWRLSRNYWRLAERLPVDDKQGRLDNFGRAQSWADQGLALDPDCAECVLWKMAAMGRLATTEGVVQAARRAATIAQLIDRGLKLRPGYVDSPSNVELANLYYAGAAFYRVVPDWFWLQWVIGVRGDKDRALAYIKKAISLSAPRVDYQVELGAVLLCMGTERSQPERVAEGMRVLQGALRVDTFQSTDEVDLQQARVLMEHPERACGFSRDGWIDLAAAAKQP